MFSLATIQRMNTAKERRKFQRRARYMNAKQKAHPKNAEKTGCPTCTTETAAPGPHKSCILR